MSLDRSYYLKVWGYSTVMSDEATWIGSFPDFTILRFKSVVALAMAWDFVQKAASIEGPKKPFRTGTNFESFEITVWTEGLPTVYEYRHGIVRFSDLSIKTVTRYDDSISIDDIGLTLEELNL